MHCSTLCQFVVITTVLEKPLLEAVDPQLRTKGDYKNRGALKLSP